MTIKALETLTDTQRHELIAELQNRIYGATDEQNQIENLINNYSTLKRLTDVLHGRRCALGDLMDDIYASRDDLNNDMPTYLTRDGQSTVTPC